MKFTGLSPAGESGPGARPCNVGWIRDVVKQCQRVGVPCFVKQLGSNPFFPTTNLNLLKHPKGGDPSEWPEDLRVRQFQQVEDAIPTTTDFAQASTKRSRLHDADYRDCIATVTGMEDCRSSSDRWLRYGDFDGLMSHISRRLLEKLRPRQDSHAAAREDGI